MKTEEIQKLLEMRKWIDDNFPDFYEPYEQKFIKKAEELGLNPRTIKAVKREMELRFNLSPTEWNLMHVLLYFSALRQGGITSRTQGHKKYDIEIKGLKDEKRKHIERMILLMWDVIE